MSDLSVFEGRECATELLEAIDEFRKDMIVKFLDRADKQGERSVTLVGSKHLRDASAMQSIHSHFKQEVDELLAEPWGSLLESREAVDVANLAFLIWWMYQVRRPGRTLELLVYGSAEASRRSMLRVTRTGRP